MNNNKANRGDEMDARIQRRLGACIGAMMLAPMGAALGAMEDALLSAELVGPAAQGYYVEPAYDVGNDYQGGHVRAGYGSSVTWSLEARYWRRHLDYGKDAADIDNWLASPSYGLMVRPDVGWKLALRLSAWGNHTSSLTKTGSAYGGKPSNFSIVHPNDAQAQADLISGAFIGAGASWRWRYGPFSLVAGYNAQYVLRETDARYAAYGAPTEPFNQTVLLQAAYSVNRYLDVFVRGQGSQNSLFGYVPTLYNPVMASRLDRSYGLVSVGLRISGF